MRVCVCTCMRLTYLNNDIFCVQCSFITYRTSSKFSWPPKPWLDVRLNHGSEQKAECRSMSRTEDRQADPAAHLMEREMEQLCNNEVNLENKEKHRHYNGVYQRTGCCQAVYNRKYYFENEIWREGYPQKIITNRNQILDRSASMAVLLALINMIGKTCQTGRCRLFHL